MPELPERAKLGYSPGYSWNTGGKILIIKLQQSRRSFNFFTHEKVINAFTLPLAVLVVPGGGLIAGWEKQEKLTDLSTTVQRVGQTQTTTSEADYEKVFIEPAAILDRTNHLTITKFEGRHIFIIESGDGGIALRTAVCHDTSASPNFARCCRSYVLANGCITVVGNNDSWNDYPCPG